MEKALEEMRKGWKATREGDGGYCPCCDRWGKNNGISISKTMARALHWLCSTPERSMTGWVNVREAAPKWVLRAGKLTAFKYWGMVETLPVDKDSSVKSSGILRPTRRAYDFVYGGLSVPKKLEIYADRVVHVEDKQHTFSDALQSEFDYQEMMGGRTPYDDYRGDE